MYERDPLNGLKEFSIVTKKYRIFKAVNFSIFDALAITY
jgi:hypothetical protein